jgi:hypothetical protein
MSSLLIKALKTAKRRALCSLEEPNSHLGLAGEGEWEGEGESERG